MAKQANEGGFYMSLLERSWLYISRKKGKTLVMFCILFIMATAMISGISIKNAANAAMRQARESVGGNFSLQVNYGENNPNIKRVETPVSETMESGMSIAGAKLINEGPPLSEELANQIKQVNGIKYANGRASLSLENNGLKHVEPKPQANQFMIGSSDFPNLHLNVNTDGQYDPLFTEQKMKLVEGRFTTAQDQYKIMIHAALAKENNLRLHDEITLLLTQSAREEFGIKETNVKVEIVGIFDDVAASKNDDILSFITPENTMITDVTTGSALMNQKVFEFDLIEFGVKDPKDLESIVDEVKKLDVDWQQFMIDTHDQEYQQMAGLIENLDGIMTLILYAIFCVSCIILSLILSLWIKGRIHETGILLSIGIKKCNIMAQYIVELLIIAILAFGLSYISGKAISQTVSDTIIEQMIKQEEARNVMTTSVISISGVDTTITSIKELDITVAGSDLIYVYMSGGILILISVLISSISMLRLNPKEILSKMS